MSKMKRIPGKNKLSRFRLRSSANNCNMSFSPRPQATISSYFSSVINELDADQLDKESEDLFGEQTQRKLKNSASTDDEDFEVPKTQKLAKIFDLKGAKEPKPKKKQRPPRTVSTFGHHVHVPACSDTNQDHIQLALAMSKSLKELENPETADSENKLFENQFVSTQEKTDIVRKTLDQFGFKTGKKLNEFSKLISNQSNNIKKKFKYITPTLFLRTEEDRTKMIESNVSAIITNISIYNVNNVPQETPEPKDCDLDSKKPTSFLLRNYYEPSGILYKKSGLGLPEMTENIFYNGTVTPSHVKPGSLLKDWSTIPGREVTPPREKIIYSETPNINNKSSESTIKDIRSCNKDSETSLDNHNITLNNIESSSNNNNNNITPNVINNKILEDNIKHCNTIIASDTTDSSTPSIDSAPNDCIQLKNYHCNQLKISSPPFSFNTNKSIHGNVSPDLFSDNEQSYLELNSPLNNSPILSMNSDRNRESNSPNLFTNSLLKNSPPISNSNSSPQSPLSSKIKNKSKSEPESISLLDISKCKSMNTSKQDVDKSDDSDRSLSLLDTVSPRRKYLLKLAKRNESKARKNIFDVEKSFASKRCKDNIEHFDSFCDDIQDVFDLTQSSNDSIALNGNKHSGPKALTNIGTEPIDSDIETNTMAKSPKEINKSRDLNINKLLGIDINNSKYRENPDSEDDYLSVTQLLQVYSKEHTMESNVVDLTQSSDEAFELRLSPEDSPELDCLSSSSNKELYDNLMLNKTAISSSGTDSSDNSPIKLVSNRITPDLSTPEKTYRKRKNRLASNENKCVEEIQDCLTSIRGENLVSSENETRISQMKFNNSSSRSPAEDQDFNRTQRKFKRTSASSENESSQDTNLNLSRRKSKVTPSVNNQSDTPKSLILSENKLMLLDNSEKVIQNMARISPNEFCYNKIYDDDINIMSFLGHVNRNEMSQYNKSVVENETLDDSVNKTNPNKPKKSFRRSLSESVIGDKEFNYFSPRSSYEPVAKLNKLDHLHQSPVQLNSKFDLPNHYANINQSCESIEISDEELNYSVLKSKDKSFIFDDFKYQPPMNSDTSDEELNYSSSNHKKSMDIFDRDTEILQDEQVNIQRNIIDINDLPTNYLHLDNPKNSINLNLVNDSIHSESLKHPRLKDLSTLNKSLSQPQSLFADSFNDLIKHNDIFNNIESAQTAQTPESHKIQQIITPNSNVIIKTTNITPMPKYDDMDTPERNKELAKFGLKPLKRAKGVKILRHIYDTTHPISQNNAEKTRESSSDEENNRIIKRRKRLSDHFGSQPTCSKSNNIIQRRSIQNKIVASSKIDEQIEIVGDKIAASVSVNDLIFERKHSSKILSCALPLHIAWHNFVSSQQDLQEKILLYEPLQVEDIYTKLKSFGYKYHVQDIIAFLDKKCITIRVSQNNRNNRK